MNENHVDLPTTDTQGRTSQGSNCGDCVHVFISHKNEDAQAAYKLRDMLKRHSNRLRFFLSEEIPPGADWRGWITDHLGRANLLFFLCTNPASNWDWCLYETGIFEGIRKGKVIVLHSHEGQAPTPLTHLQSIPATRDRVAEFLRVFFGTSDITEIEPPLNESLASKNNLLMDIADEIVALFAQAVSARPHYFHRHLVVRIPETDPCRGNTMPDQSRVDADRPSGRRQRQDLLVRVR
jgi:hypothetical protein